MKLNVNEFRLKIYPRDFAKVRAFYEETLEFPVIHEWDNGEHNKGAMFRVGTTTFELLSPEGEHRPILGVTHLFASTTPKVLRSRFSPSIN